MPFNLGLMVLQLQQQHKGHGLELGIGVMYLEAVVK